MAEANALDPSIYPFATRKGNTMSRFRVEGSTLLTPRVVFLTGATGYLGVHILAEILMKSEYGMQKLHKVTFKLINLYLLMDHIRI